MIKPYLKSKGEKHMIEIGLKDRAYLKRIMYRIGKAAADIKRAAHSFDIKETKYLQMQELEAFATEAKTIMETFKSTEPDAQGILLDLDSEELVPGKLTVFPNGSEPEEE